MPPSKVYDREGCPLDVVEVDGERLPDFKLPGNTQEEAYKSIKNWKARDDDILLWAYPKSGTHWLWDILHQIFQNKTEVVDFHKSTYMLEALTEEKYDALPSPRILNTHIDLGAWPHDFLQRKCKIIYLIRNPKDVAVSFYHHHGVYSAYKGKWEHYLEDLYLSGKVDSRSWFDHLQQYEDFVQKNPDYPVHFMSYEDIHKDGIHELTKLMDFLGKDVKRDLVEKVYDMNKFEQVKKDKTELVKHERLHPIWLPMYRKGKIGDWKNQFTVAQNEMFNAEYKKRMMHSNISVVWSYEPQ